MYSSSLHQQLIETRIEDAGRAWSVSGAASLRQMGPQPQPDPGRRFRRAARRRLAARLARPAHRRRSPGTGGPGKGVSASASAWQLQSLAHQVGA